jgi:hypothetical protein
MGMPFPRTWSEDLIAEWLQLEGYFVETGVPIRSGRKGGRSEANVLGIRLKADMLEIFHIEVGSLTGNPKDNAEMIKEKFSDERVDALREYVSRKLEFSTAKSTTYKKLYVAVWWSDRTLAHLEKEKLPIKTLINFIKDTVKPTIHQWKNEPPHKPQIIGKTITLPEGMWLLYLVDYLLG